MLKIFDGCKAPTRGTKNSAGVDLYSSENVMIYPNATAIVGLGVALSGQHLLADDIYLEVHPRSSLRAKGIMAGVGIIDTDYIDHEIKIIVHNLSERPMEIKKDQRIAQLVVKTHKTDLLGFTSDVVRDGGLGSTGEV